MLNWKAGHPAAAGDFALAGRDGVREELTGLGDARGAVRCSAVRGRARSTPTSAHAGA